MRRLALLCALIALPLFAAIPGEGCRPLVTIDGSRGTADFSACSGNLDIDVKASVTLDVQGRQYTGYVSYWQDRKASFELSNDVPPSRATSARLTVTLSTPQSWNARIQLIGASAPPPPEQRQQQQQQQQQQQTPVKPEKLAVAPPNTAGLAAPTTPVPLPPSPIDADVVGFVANGNLLRAGLASGGSIILDGATWQLERARPETDRVPWIIDGVLSAADAAAPPPGPINAATYPVTWAVADKGQAFRYDGTTWVPVQTGIADRNLLGIAMKGNEGVIVGEKGLVLTTTDGGVSWKRADAPTTADLRAVSFTTAGTFYAAGAGGVVLRSADRGARWSHVTREQTEPLGLPLPAPWFILLNLVVTIPALVMAARGQPEDESVEESESIADLLVSDRALEAGEPDALNLRAIALGISRFLRNEKTVPPLTVAVTGEWGSGKSSLMNLLKADLSEFGFRPVWFNAWHHQKEAHFLASLVNAIRNDAAPPWWHVPFRMRLLWIRSKRNPGTVAFVLLAVAVLFGYEAHDEHNIVGSVVDALRGGRFWDFLVELPSKIKDEFAIVISVAGAIGALWKGLVSFAAKPAALLATVSSKANLGDLDKEISFRGRFAPEFNDVTTALGDRPLVLFIDDLDRCEPASVREMLEAVNYLITSGPCFIVLGIDRMRVERYVNIAFGEAAKGEPNFAGNYLDKLINIEVPIPTPNDRESLQILAPAASEPETNTRWMETVRATMAAAWAMKPAIVAASVIAVGVMIGSTMRPQVTPPENAAIVAAASADPGLVTADVVPINTTRFRTGDPGQVVAGIPRSQVWVLWPVALILAAVGSVGGWLITRKPGLVVYDSDAFIEALGAWQPLVAARSRTPRSLKRFVNRVRYLAMRQRPQEEEATMWRTIRATLAGKRLAPPLKPDAAPIPEPTLVALAAISYNANSGPSHDEAVRLSQTNHEKKFGALEKEKWIAQFARISADVKVN